MTPTDPPHRTVADKINHLFDVVRPDGGSREYTGREVVAEIADRGGELSASHLSELRRGIKTNPTLRVLDGLARFFDVRVAYFTDDARAVEEVEAELALRAAMRDAQVQDIALRLAGLDPQQRSAAYRLLADIIRENDGAQPDSP